MSDRIYFLSAVLLATLTLLLHATSRRFDVKSTSIRAQMWNRSDVEKQQAKTQADQYRARASAIFYTGLGFTFCSIGCLAVARFRKERGRYSIPILLLFFDLIMQRLL